MTGTLEQRLSTPVRAAAPRAAAPLPRGGGVNEVDGVQHYGRPNPSDEQRRVTHTAAPQLCAEIVAEEVPAEAGQIRGLPVRRLGTDRPGR